MKNINCFLTVATVIVAVAANSGNISCKELDYTNQQLCHIRDALDWTCLKTKALLLNKNSYSCPERSYHDGLHACGYVEICAFSDEDFLCDGKYICTSVTDGVVNCTKDQLDYHVWKCVPSLLYCRGENNGSPFSANWNDITNCIDGKLRIKEFIKYCIPQYESPYSTHPVWYYVKFSHYDNVSAQQSFLQSVHHPEWTGNEAKLCPVDPDFSTIAVPAVVVGIVLLVGIIFLALKGRNKLEKVIEKQQIHIQNIVDGILRQGTTEKASYIESDVAYKEFVDAISVDEFDDTALPTSEPAPTDKPTVFNSDELTTSRTATHFENDHEQANSSELQDMSEDEDLETKAFETKFTAKHESTYPDTNILPYIQKPANVNVAH